MRKNKVPSDALSNRPKSNYNMHKNDKETAAKLLEKIKKQRKGKKFKTIKVDEHTWIEKEIIDSSIDENGNTINVSEVKPIEKSNFNTPESLIYPKEYPFMEGDTPKDSYYLDEIDLSEDNESYNDKGNSTMPENLKD